MEGNLKDIYVHFEGGSTISTALAMSGVYRPKNTIDWFQKNYSYITPQSEGRDLRLFIRMSAGDKDTINFSFQEYQDWNDPSYDFNQEAKKLGEFTINLSSTLGPKDWKFYLDSKERGIISVRTSEEHKKVWDADNNFHNYLASKLNAALKKNGLVHFWDKDDQSAEQLLIGTYLEYRELAHNPKLISRKLGLS